MTFHKPASWTQICLWKTRFKARYCLTVACLFLAKLHYYFLCFKHFGWLRLVIFILKMPEHLKAVALALFTHPHDFNAKKLH